MKFSRNIIILLVSVFIIYVIIDFSFRARREHFGVENVPVRESNDVRYIKKDDVYSSENEKILYDERQHVLADDFKKYFYFSEIDIPNGIMLNALRRIIKRNGKISSGYYNYEWENVPKRIVSKSQIEIFVKKMLKMINRELPRSNLDTYWKPELPVQKEGEKPYEPKPGDADESYYDYDDSKKYIQYYKLHHFKIVNIQKYRKLFKWVINMYIYRPEKATMFVIQVGALKRGKSIEIVGLKLISRKSVDEDFLDTGYDEKIENYKYIYEDPNLICDMPEIFNERKQQEMKNDCNDINYNNVARNRIPDKVTSSEKDIREILDARNSGYKGFFRPVRFSFGEQALVNRKILDDVVPATNQRFLDRI